MLGTRHFTKYEQLVKLFKLSENEQIKSAYITMCERAASIKLSNSMAESNLEDLIGKHIISKYLTLINPMAFNKWLNIYRLNSSFTAIEYTINPENHGLYYAITLAAGLKPPSELQLSDFGTSLLALQAATIKVNGLLKDAKVPESRSFFGFGTKPSEDDILNAFNVFYSASSYEQANYLPPVLRIDARRFNIPMQVLNSYCATMGRTLLLSGDSAIREIINEELAAAQSIPDALDRLSANVAQLRTASLSARPLSHIARSGITAAGAGSDMANRFATTEHLSTSCEHTTSVRTQTSRRTVQTNMPSSPTAAETAARRTASIIAPTTDPSTLALATPANRTTVVYPDSDPRSVATFGDPTSSPDR